MTENKSYLNIPLSRDRAIFVTGSTDHQGPIVHVGEGEPGMFPRPATLSADRARQVRDALTQWLEDVTEPLPIWKQMSDLDKGAALLHHHKIEVEGTEYATSDYPAAYFDHPALTALDGEAASKHAQGLFGDKDVFDTLGGDEYYRLYDLALDADGERTAAKFAKRESGEASC